ncbi:FHA domain-containing protein [Microbulbifer sp. TYP-18]|uniref:FHA domain-containing protein n=1 Tax=Microbulbifer sp. TYP-18 TaxID=3230024 RepID=UPI0034C5E51A
MLKLCDLSDASVSVWLVAPKVTIGRAAGCDLTIADETVAKLHAEVVIEGEQLMLHNLAGKQLWMNDKPVETSCAVGLNDRVKVGSRELMVVDPKVTKLQASAAAAPVSWALRANHPAIAGRVFPIRESTVVGRSDESDITFSLSHLSRRHARLEIRGGLLFVTDLGSANGTYLNNERVSETRVRRGDELRFDTLSFSIVGPADDRDRTTVRPVVTAAGERRAGASVASLRNDIPSPTEATVERRRYDAGQTAADGGRGVYWVLGMLVLGAVAGLYWVYSRGLV